MAKPFKLTKRHFDALRRIADGREHHVGDLPIGFGTASIGRLVDAGLAEKRTFWQIRITPAGRAALEEATK